VMQPKDPGQNSDHLSRLMSEKMIEFN